MIGGYHKKKNIKRLLVLFLILNLVLPNAGLAQSSDAETITRAEFISLVNKAFGYNDQEEINFTDVSSKDWFAVEIAKAKAAKYISGYQDGSFKPNRPITRQEVAAILSRILIPNSAKFVNYITFADEQSIPEWSKAAINAVITNGIMAGYSDQTYQPRKTITRAEALGALDKAVGQLYNTGGVIGPGSGLDFIKGNATISAADTTLRNTVIFGNLYLTEGIGEGNVELDNVIVKGRTLIRGGGANSIYVNNSNLGEAVVNKPNGNVRVVAKGKTSIKKVTLNSGAKLEESEIAGQGFIDINVAPDTSTKSNVQFVGNFENVEITSPNANLEVLAGDINKLNVSKNASSSTVKIAKEAKVKTVEINSAVSITGEGKVTEAIINANDVNIEQTPDNIVVAQDVTATVGDKEVDETTNNDSDDDSDNTTNSTEEDSEVDNEDEEDTSDDSEADNEDEEDGTDNTEDETGDQDEDGDTVEGDDENGSSDVDTGEEAGEPNTAPEINVEGLEGLKEMMEQEFSITTTANDFENNMVVAEFAISKPDGSLTTEDIAIYYEEVSQAEKPYLQLPLTEKEGNLVGIYGPQPEGFPLTNVTSNFKVTFAAGQTGDYTLRISLVSAENTEILATNEFNVQVAEMVEPTIKTNGLDSFEETVEKEFSVTTEANDCEGMPVVAQFTISNNNKALLGDELNISYQEMSLDGAPYLQLPLQVQDGKLVGFFGPSSSGFPLNDITSNFKATFAEGTAGQYTVNINIIHGIDGMTVTSESFEIQVKPLEGEEVEEEPVVEETAPEETATEEVTGEETSEPVAEEPAAEETAPEETATEEVTGEETPEPAAEKQA